MNTPNLVSKKAGERQDSNGDGLVIGNDIISFVADILNGMPTSSHYCASDMNGDSIVDLDDPGGFVAILLMQ